VFTGLVAAKGRIAAISRNSESAIFEIESALASEISTGDSVSVSGVCLTAITVSNKGFSADVMIQTLRLTSLASLVVGSEVNLELAARPIDRLGGHIVQGHVDGVGSVLENAPGEKWNKFVIKIPAHLAKYVVNQGSIAVEGVSLTVGAIAGDEVTLWLIPETLMRTNLATKSAGDLANIEVDVIAKYVERLVNNERT